MKVSLRLSEFSRLPYLPEELWRVILCKAGLLACLNFNFIDLAWKLHDQEEEDYWRTYLETACKQRLAYAARTVTELRMGREAEKPDVGAARTGYVDHLRWLQEWRGKISPAALLEAANWGQIHVVEWFLKQYPEMLSAEVLERAAARGHHPIIDLIYERGLYRTNDAMTRALEGRHPETARWLHSKWNATASAETLDAAIL